MQNKSITATLLWDRLGVSLSTICAIHCLIFPVLISVLPLWPLAASIHGWLHPVFIILLIPVVFFAARRSHYDFAITTTLVGGLLLVILGWLIGHYWLGEWVELILTLSGSLVLIAGHWFNYRHHRHCSNKSHAHHPVASEIANN